MIRRSDGSALYNLAVAVDDRDMGITHVIRGEDHLSNTPRQVMILRALGIDPPIYAHLPLLHGPDGKKLSKRHGAASVQELRDSGYLPEAVRNYIALLGWGLDEATTIMTTEQMVEGFDARPGVEVAGGVRRAEAALDERPLPARDAPRRAGARGSRRCSAAKACCRPSRLAQEKMQTLADFMPLAGFLLERARTDEKAWAKVMKEGAAERLAAAREALAASTRSRSSRSRPPCASLCERLDEKPNKVFQPIRVAITGGTISPGIFESLAALGQATSRCAGSMPPCSAFPSTA